MRLKRISPSAYMEIEDRPTVKATEQNEISGSPALNLFDDTKDCLKWNRKFNRVTFRLKNLRRSFSYRVHELDSFSDIQADNVVFPQIKPSPGTQHSIEAEADMEGLFDYYTIEVALPDKENKNISLSTPLRALKVSIGGAKPVTDWAAFPNDAHQGKLFYYNGNAADEYVLYVEAEPEQVEDFYSRVTPQMEVTVTVALLSFENEVALEAWSRSLNDGGQHRRHFIVEEGAHAPLLSMQVFEPDPRDRHAN